MNFIKIEELTMQQLTMPSLHSHYYYEIYFLYEGQRLFFFNNTLFTITAPALLIIPPHTPHKTEGKDFKRVNVYITENYLTSFQKDFIDNKKLSVLTFTKEQALSLLDILDPNTSITPATLHYVDIQKSKFDYFMLKVHQLNQLEKNNSLQLKNEVSPIVLKTINYMNQNYSQPLTLESLSKILFISPSTLLYHFKKYLNCSPINYLVSLRIIKVKEALTMSYKTINQIAIDCGFINGNHLSLVFKKREGIAPMAYRKKYRPTL